MKVTAVISGKAQLARFRRGCSDFVFNAITATLKAFQAKPQHVVVAGRGAKLIAAANWWNS